MSGKEPLAPVADDEPDLWPPETDAVYVAALRAQGFTEAEIAIWQAARHDFSVARLTTLADHRRN